MLLFRAVCSLNNPELFKAALPVFPLNTLMLNSQHIVAVGGMDCVYRGLCNTQ
jgi:hypothetical protein